jgi:hypothetical protein
MSSRLPYAVFALAAGFLVGTVTQARAESITFKVCDGQKLSFKQPKGTDKLQAFCPGRPLPVLTLNGCVGPHVKLVDGFYVVTCDKLIPYTPGVPVK